MKKKLALILVIALALVGTVACGSKKDSDSPKKEDTSQAQTNDKKDTDVPADDAEEKALTVAWWGNQTRNDRTIATLDLYTEQNPNVIFDGQFSEWGDYWNKLAIASAGHSLPDIVQMDYKYLEQYVSNDLLVDLTPYIEDGTLDVSGIDQGIMDSGSMGDGIYALCLGVNAPSLFYNKTLLDEHGITIKDNMTMDEFIEVSKEINEKTGYKTNVAYNNGENFAEYFMRASGAVLFDSGKLGVDSAEELIPYFEIYEKGIEEGWHIGPSVFAEIDPGSVEQSPMLHGSGPENMSWCALLYSNQLTAVENAAPEGMEIGVTTWPSPNPGLSNYLKPSQFFSITKDSQDPAEAAKILDFFTNSVEANEILLGERGVPASAPVADAIASKLSETEITIIDFINNVVSINNSTLNPPASDGASEVFNLLDILQERICYGQMTAVEAANELFEEGNKFLSAE